MSWRAIHDTVGRSESLGQVSHLAERLYWRLLAHSDPYGRVHGSPAKTRAQCFPLLEVDRYDVGWALVEMEDVGRVWIYPTQDGPVIQIVDFEDNQPGELKRKRGASRLESAPEGLKAGTRTAYARTIYELPANHEDARTRAPESGPTPVQSRESRESRGPKEVAAGRAREALPEDDAAAALEELEPLMDELALPGALRVAARSVPVRALAVARYTLAQHGSGAYFRTVFDSGDWPSTSNGHKPVANPRQGSPREVRPDACPECEIVAGHTSDCPTLKAADA